METFTKSKPPQLRLLRFTGGHKTVDRTIDTEKQLAIRQFADLLINDRIPVEYVRGLRDRVAQRLDRTEASPSA